MACFLTSNWCVVGLPSKSGTRPALLENSFNKKDNISLEYGATCHLPDSWETVDTSVDLLQDRLLTP